MMKFIILAVVLFQCFFGKISTLNIEQYARYIDELSENPKFVEEYAKWSIKLFSQPDYLYGKQRNNFQCPKIVDVNGSTSVHTLQPSDIRCVGAIGDSLTAGLGAHAVTPVGLVYENRGVSWSVGGDHSYSTVLTVPNTIREYNPDLHGFSTKVSVIFLNGQNASNNGLNVARSGDNSTDMPNQAKILMDRMRNNKVCDWNNDWKLITFFIGGNDLCSFCNDPNVTAHSPEQYLEDVVETLDTLYNAPIPRTLVNLVLVLDVRGVQQLNSGGFVCELLHKRTCPCAAFPTPDQARTLENYVPRYHQLLTDLAASNRYDGRDDFTVVVQPFMAETQLPRTDKDEIDFSYFAPDCFHFSGKGHAQAALSLWNNMFEPVGAKQRFWHKGEELKCPTKEYPYIFTKKNSAKALQEHLNAMSATQVEPDASVAKSTTEMPEESTTKHHKHHKGHKSNSSSFSKMQMIFIASMFLLTMIVLILAISKRERIRHYVHRSGRRHINGFSNPQTPDDDDDDVEIWNRANVKSGISMNKEIPTTYGTRISFE